MSGMGLRGVDLRVLLMVARQFNIVILVRHTNASSLTYVGQAGYYPKPALIKAKTADVDPETELVFSTGLLRKREYRLAGLVVHPGFHPHAFEGAKAQKVMSFWEDTLKILAPDLVHRKVNPAVPESTKPWGEERPAASAPRWRFKIDVNRDSKHFGCLMLKGGDTNWAYIHGDYDLKDIIAIGHERYNDRHEGHIDGVRNFTPLLPGFEFEQIQRSINTQIGTPMIQHGSEAQFAWHGDEPTTIAYPDWRFEVLMNAEAVQSWYEKLGRKVLAKTGHDYLRDRYRMWYAGPQGITKPGEIPAGILNDDIPQHDASGRDIGKGHSHLPGGGPHGKGHGHQHGKGHGQHGKGHGQHGKGHGDHGKGHGDHGKGHDQHGKGHGHDPHGKGHADHGKGHGHDQHGKGHADHGKGHGQDQHGKGHADQGKGHGQNQHGKGHADQGKGHGQNQHGKGHADQGKGHGQNQHGKGHADQGKGHGQNQHGKGHADHGKGQGPDHGKGQGPQGKGQGQDPHGKGHGQHGKG